MVGHGIEQVLTPFRRRHGAKFFHVWILPLRPETVAILPEQRVGNISRTRRDALPCAAKDNQAATPALQAWSLVPFRPTILRVDNVPKNFPASERAAPQLPGAKGRRLLIGTTRSGIAAFATTCRSAVRYRHQLLTSRRRVGRQKRRGTLPAFWTGLHRCLSHQLRTLRRPCVEPSQWCAMTELA